MKDHIFFGLYMRYFDQLRPIELNNRLAKLKVSGGNSVLSGLAKWTVNSY